ncbi:hypothetical protein ACW9H6_00810 [Pseudomonas sp. SDO528_S397]
MIPQSSQSLHPTYTPAERKLFQVVPAPLNETNTSVISATAKNHERIDVSFPEMALSPQDISRTNLPPGTPLPEEGNYSFIFSEHHKKWFIGGKHVSYLSPFRVGAVIPDSPPPVTFYCMSDSNWTPSISLPKKARDNDLIIIESSASKEVRIEGASMLGRRETRMYRYSEVDQAWKPVNAQAESVIKAKPVIPEPPVKPQPPVRPEPIKPAPPAPAALEQLNLTGAKTEILLPDTSKTAAVKLPDIANDNDLVTLSSAAPQSVRVDTANINNSSAMTLDKGETYIFKYLAKHKKWEMIRSPQTVYTAQNLHNGAVPALSKPMTFVHVDAHSPTQPLTFPSNQPPGSKIVVVSRSNTPVTINAGALQASVKPEEVITFTVDKDQRWTRETVTIDILFTYSDKLAKEKGLPAIKQYVSKAMSDTNTALLNSGANFFYRAVAVKELEDKEHWDELSVPLKELQEHPKAQAMLETYKADGLYYLTNRVAADIVGLAHLGAHKSTMIATSIMDSTYVVRHELAHLMGVAHSGESDSYNQGLKGKTVMGFAWDLFYSNPDRYTPDGEPLGIEGKANAVRTMNEASARVAAFR